MRKLLRIVAPIIIVAMLSAIAIPVLASTQYENYITGDDNYTFCYGTDILVGQTFTPASNHTITSVKLKLYRVGSPGTVYVYLTGTSSGHPNGYDIKRTGTFNGNTITTNTAGEWVTITFTSYTVASGTKYAFVVKATSGDGSNYIRWRYDSTSASFSGGNYEYTTDGGVSWTSSTGSDCMFDVYGESLTVAPTVTTQAASSITSTTATGNGNITATGGENCTIRGICYNETGSPTTADSKVEESGSFSTGAFTESLTGLSPGHTYYLKAYATNSAGTSYGSEVSFTTSVAAPAITINEASNITMDTARLNSIVTSDGGEACQVRWGYGTTTQTAGNFASYDTVTDWTTADWTSSEHPYYDVSSLADNTTYFFRVQIKNSDSTVTSDEETFDTLASVNPPTQFKGIATSSSISLSWIKGVGASSTLIKYAFANWDEATMYTSGTQLYSGVGSSVEHTGLTPGTMVYYWAWGISGVEVSDGVQLLSITLAGGTTGVNENAPTQPTNWFIDTDYTTMSGLGVVYDTVNGIADGTGVPRSTAWMLGAIFISVVASFGTYELTGRGGGDKSLVAAGIVLMVMLGLFSAVHLLALWILFVSIVVVIGVGFGLRNM